MERLDTILYQVMEVRKLFVKFMQSSAWKTYYYIDLSRDEDIERYFAFLDQQTVSFGSISNSIHHMKKNLPDGVHHISTSTRILEFCYHSSLKRHQD
jgi:hypothetical protein